jgi:hypothetical protein
MFQEKQNVSLEKKHCLSMYDCVFVKISSECTDVFWFHNEMTLTKPFMLTQQITHKLKH